MLLDHNPYTYAAVVGMKYFVNYIGLYCLVYFFAIAFAFGRAGIVHPVSIVIEAYGLVEILWYLLWFLPFKARLQRPGLPMTPMTRAQRKKLIANALQTVPDVRLFVRKWFCQAHIDQIYRDNIKDWMAWALFAKEDKDLSREEWDELDEYVDEAQEQAGLDLPRGRADGKPMRLNLDPVEMYHRPLLWYFFMSFTEIACWAFLAVKGFTFYRQPRRTFFSIFPFRPMTLLAPHASASKDFSYYYRPHRSKTHRPVLFCHGIGIGVATYTTWLPSIPADIGIIAIEVMPAANRICPEGKPPQVFARAVAQILRQHKIDDFVLVGHSYGTFMARPLLDHPEVAPKINSMILCDPVAILLHLPNVAYNITRRKGVTTPEIEIDFGAGKDPMIAHLVCRRFHWPEHILFREDFAGRRTTAVVAGRDCVLDGPAVASYVHYGRVDQTSYWDQQEMAKTWRSWTGRGDIELMYLPDRDHGQSLLLPKLARRISEAIATYADLSKDPSTTTSLEPMTEVPQRSASPPESHRGLKETVGIPLEDIAHHSQKVRTLAAIKTDSNSSSDDGRTMVESPDEWRNTHFIESYASNRYSVPDPTPPQVPRNML
ncbi:hypothetical protein PG994_014046 [Apiospora phragmitis]|uniref:AB hydrolase-1 domain-containing protein n=1 Tax=Apiospora phragmitis TaxID=2905665 RepID=A0ABR1T393_9PEZI